MFVCRTMIGCATCLCASITLQYFASWRDADSPRHRPCKGFVPQRARVFTAVTQQRYKQLQSARCLARAPDKGPCVCVCTSLAHEIMDSQPFCCCLDRFDSFVPIYQVSGGEWCMLSESPLNEDAPSAW